MNPETVRMARQVDWKSLKAPESDPAKNRFLNPQKGLETTVAAESPVQFCEENVLVFASGKNIHVLERGRPSNIIVSRPGNVMALCSNDGKLYDAGNYGGMFETLTTNLVAPRSGTINALCAYRGNIHDAGSYKSVFRTSDNRKFASRTKEICALCCHDGRLYDAGNYNSIFATFENVPILSRWNPVLKWLKDAYNLLVWQKDAEHDDISALCSYDGKLYYASQNKIFDTQTKKEVASRAGRVTTLAVHDGKMYDGGWSGIFETLARKKVDPLGNLANALCSHPRKYFVDAGVLK